MATTPNNVDNVGTGKPKVGGAVFVGATSLTLPTSTATALPTGFENLGYVSDNGVSNDGSITVSNTKAWGGDIVDSSETEKKDTFSFTLIEVLNEAVLKEVYVASNVTTASSEIHVAVKNTPHEKRAFVIDTIIKGAAKRIVIPNGKITNVEAITYKDSDPVGYNVTVTAYPDSGGATHHEYIKKAVTA